MAVDGFPNLWFAAGPNSGLTSGSAVPIIEKQVDYAVAAVAKMQRERLRSIEVKQDAVRDFNNYAQEYFKKVCQILTIRLLAVITSIQTVYLENCSNWYLSPVDGVLTGLWPGKQQFVAVDMIRCSYPTQGVAFTTSPRSRIRAGKTTTTSILLTTGSPIGSTGLEMASRTLKRL